MLFGKETTGSYTFNFSKGFPKHYQQGIYTTTTGMQFEEMRVRLPQCKYCWTTVEPSPRFTKDNI